MKRTITALALALSCLIGIPSGFSENTGASKTAIFAGGCFWCMQPPFDHAKGVIKTVVGYTGGSAADATYAKVSAHQTQHRESIEVTYDPAQISYDQLLDMTFWGAKVLQYRSVEIAKHFKIPLFYPVTRFNHCTILPVSIFACPGSLSASRASNTTGK